jgi:RuvB-like protein 1 (pontin 52)
MLDLEAFTFLNRALESPLSPLVILASNRGNTHIRGGENLPPSAHGIPSDPYGPAEIKSIITTRVTTEKLNISGPAKDKVSSLGEKVSLRYALQLLAPASVLAEVNGRENKQIEVEDVEECQDLFLDARRSAQALGETDGYIS